jgi:hypothetical protein
MSPVLAASHSNLPPTFFQICGLDPLRDDAFLYDRLLREAGCKTNVKVYVQFPRPSVYGPDKLAPSSVILVSHMSFIGSTRSSNRLNNTSWTSELDCAGFSTRVKFHPEKVNSEASVSHGIDLSVLKKSWTTRLPAKNCHLDSL